MKKTLALLFLFVSFLQSCSSDDNNTTPADDTAVAKEYTDVHYGSDPQQIMDVYLPAGRTAATKVIILIHGGAWIAGSKEDFADFIPLIKTEFPGYAIVNINYRLATETSAAFPKQIDDVKKAIAFLKNESGYTISSNYGLIGTSAGAHIAMLYSYKYDTSHEVKAICNIVGPADFLDPAYVSHPLYPLAGLYVIGSSTPSQQAVTEVSPIAHITAQAPPTLSFYGGQDQLIPATQGPRLKAALDAAGVVNQFNFYPNGGHGDWDDATFAEVYAKLTAFFEVHF
ncbi:alpha/beta hydrolase [Flavobacterium psychrotrophum]|uniref:alpha/beta hydrolase n=1 Tax=Flavobacterium psychrotrophum TaxID=2294119 RepID=UPI0013C47FE7|nr:alpha/beta hydrolase [Flavobacterium psychrotrophum]